MATDWGEEVREFRAPTPGNWRVTVKGIGEYNSGDRAGQSMTSETEKGPQTGIEIALIDDGTTAVDWITWNARTAWRIKALNKAVGCTRDALKSILQARDSEITDNAFPTDLVTRVVSMWEGRSGWVNVSYEAGRKGPRIKWLMSEPTVKGPIVGAAAEAAPTTGEDNAPPF